MADADDKVSIDIGTQLASLSQASQGYDIFKVPTYLRRQKVEDCEPILVGIGPYNRFQGELTKAHKLCCLQKLLERTGERDVKRYVKALREVEKRARQCYAPDIYMGTDAFVEMMLVDGCFIVELLRMHGDDDILRHAWMRHIVVRDLLLLENQLPFFVLRKLYKMTSEMSDDCPQQPFAQLACKFFNDIVPGSAVEIQSVEPGSIKHLLHLLDEAWVLRFVRHSSFKKEIRGPMDWRKLRCATELVNAGITFEEGESKEMFDIQFKNGRLEIPQIRIDDRTESLLRNLLAYEQCSEEAFEFCVFDYVLFMDGLIDSSKDVQLLLTKNIIINNLGDDKAVAKMFNRLTYLNAFPRVFYYAQTFDQVNKFCNKKLNTWMATLRHRYFHSPWSVIAFIAAAILLLTSLLQTAYTIAPFHNTRP